MIIKSRLMIAAVAVCGSTFGAYAADLAAPPPVLSYPTPVAEPSGGGWYLRGDVGVGINYSSSIYETSIANQTPPASAGWINRSLNNSTNIDVGVGYQFTDNLRGDVTLQYRASSSFQAGNYITNPNNNPSTGINSITGSMSSTVALANGYYDITTWNGLTPFVGAGIGMAYNQTSSVNSLQQGGFNPPLYGVYNGKGTANFAWALHTGLSYDINPRLKLELGYSYLNYGTAKASPLTCYGGGAPITCNDSFQLRKLYSNDFHIGMRWLFDAQASASSQASFSQSTWQQPTSTYQSSTGQAVAKY